jgi:ribosomal protein L37AE/L43A
MSNNHSISGIEVFEISNPQNDINNQILLAMSENSFIREVTVNAYEFPSCATEIIWGSTDPALVGIYGFNTVKLSCYNNGTGMTKAILEKVTNFSSSNGKNAGLHGNKGKGEKLSGMAINSKGMIWVSCTEDPDTKLRKVYRVVMEGDAKLGLWGKKKFYVENEFSGSEETVVDITDSIDLETLGLDIDKDWTLKIYCGVEYNQNTVENPYGVPENEENRTGVRTSGGNKKDSVGWLIRELSRRFPVLPEGVKIKLAHKHLTNDGKSDFQPVLNAIKEYSQDDKIKYETVTVHLNVDTPIGKPTGETDSLGRDISFFTENNTVNITYVYDPHCGMKGNETKSTVWYRSRMGVTGVYSGLIYKNELYDFRGPQKNGDKGAPNWKATAYELGIIDGYDQFRIFVSLPNADHIVNDENRTKIIDQTSSSKEEFLLKNYRAEVKAGMPQWFKDLMESFAPKVPDDKELQEKYNNLLENWGQYQPARKDSNGESNGLSKSGEKKNQSTHDNECPECARSNTITIIPRGVRKCPVCGFIKPGNTGTSSDKPNYIEDSNGKSRTIKKWPEIKVFHQASEWKDVNLVENFSKMAAEYHYDLGKLYINATYSSFSLLTNKLLESVNVDETHPKYDEIYKYAVDKAENFIKDDCLCAGLFSAILKTTAPGFKGDDESWKRSVQPSVLSVYADHWLGSSMGDGSLTESLFRNMKSWAKRFKEDDDALDENSLSKKSISSSIKSQLF